MLPQWRKGAKPGQAPKQARKTPEAIVETKKKYEQIHRKRSFLSSWQDSRPWLEYDEANEMMFCNYCKLAGKENQYTKGTKSMRIDAIGAHELSKQHQDATAAWEAAAKPVTDSTAAKTLHKLKEHEHKQLLYKFKNAHAVAKKHKSFKTYEWLCELDQAKGLDIGNTYLTDKKCREFIGHIADSARAKSSAIFSKALFFGLTCDGTSDFIGDEYESLFIRTSISGKVKESFVKVGSANSASGKDIYHFITSEIEQLDLSKEKLVGFCSDGAANMQGRRSGVAAFLAEDQEEIVIIHCLAHRLELAFKDAIKAAAGIHYEKVITMLMGLYYFYRRGPKQKKGLRRAFDALSCTVILPTRVGGTRWLPHIDRAIEALIKGYRPIRYHLEDISSSNPKAEGIVNLMKDSSVMESVLTLKEIISPLMKLSLSLQKKETTLADGMFRINATRDVLIQMKTRSNAAVETLVVSNSYQGESLKKPRRAAKIPRAELIDNLETALSNRFPVTDIIEATSITGFYNWPMKDEKAAISDFGTRAVDTVIQKMGSTLEKAGVELSEVQTEWTYLKSLVYQKFGSPSDGLSWEQVLRRCEDIRNISALIDLLLSLPPTSVSNETTFSRTKLAKNKRRGHLKTSTLNDLIMVNIETQDIKDFDPEEAIKSWMVTPSGRRRRIGYTRRQPLTRTEVVDEMDPTGDETEMVHTPAPVAVGAALANKLDEDSESDIDDEDSYEDEGNDSAYESENELAEEDVYDNLSTYMK